MPPCPFVMKRLERDEIFGTPRLVDAWWRAVTTQPVAYLHHRATFMWTFLAGSNLVLPYYDWQGPTATYGSNPYFKPLLALHHLLQPTVLCLQLFWLILAVGVVRHRAAGASDTCRRIRRRRQRLGDRLRHDFPGGRGRGRFPLWVLVRARNACGRRRGAAGVLRPPDRVSALVSPALCRWFSSNRSSTGAYFRDHAVDDPLPVLGRRRGRVADHAAVGKPRIVGAPGPARSTIEHQRLDVASRFRIGDRFGRPISPRRTRSGASASITEVSLLPPWTSRPAASGSAFDRSNGWMTQALSRAIAAQLADQILQDAAIAAVPIDDQEIARRQRADDLVRDVLDQPDEAFERQAHGARRPIVLAREAKGDGRKLPQVEVVTPTRDDPARELLGDDPVGIERQMRPVLLDRADRQAEDRGLLEIAGNLGKREVAERSAWWRATHLAWHPRAIAAGSVRAPGRRRPARARRRLHRRRRAPPEGGRACVRRAWPWRSDSADCRH